MRCDGDRRCATALVAGVALIVASCGAGAIPTMLHIETHAHVLVPLSDDDPSPALCVLACLDDRTGELAGCLERCPNHVTADGACPPSDGSARFACARRDGERTEKVTYACNEAAIHVRPGDVVVACDDGGRHAVAGLARGVAVFIAAIATAGSVYFLWLLTHAPWHG